MYLLQRVENTMAKEEIAHHEQFLHFPQWFQMSSAAGVRKHRSISGKGFDFIKKCLLRVRVKYNLLKPAGD